MLIQLFFVLALMSLMVTGFGYFDAPEYCKDVYIGYNVPECIPIFDGYETFPEIESSNELKDGPNCQVISFPGQKPFCYEDWHAQILKDAEESLFDNSRFGKVYTSLDIPKKDRGYLENFLEVYTRRARLGTYNRPNLRDEDSFYAEILNQLYQRPRRRYKKHILPFK